MSPPTQALKTATVPAEGEPPVAVAMLTNLFAPVVSGSSTQSMGLAAALAARGHRVVIITARVDPQSPAHEVIDGYDVYRLPALRLPKMSIALNFPWLNWTFWPANLRRMERILRDHDIEIFHIHNHMFDMAFAGVVLRKRLGLPVVLTFHTVIKHSNMIYNAALYPLDRYFLKFTVVDRADAVVCPDQNMRAYVEERFGRNDAAIVNYGLDPPPPPNPADVERLRDQFNLRGREVLLSVGHVHSIRNRVDLIRALPLVREAIPNVVLLVVGGVFDQTPARLVKQLGLEDHVVFAGAQPRALIPSFFATARAEAHWLNQDDGSWASPGIASLEAMYAGLATFTVAPENIFGEDVLRQGENVILVEPQATGDLARKIIDVMRNPDVSRSIGEAASALCEAHFNWESVARRTQDVYARHAKAAPGA